MGCFIVPLVQAIGTTIYRAGHKTSSKDSVLRRNVPALEKMLWGGSVMLIVDHIANGELTPQFPFLTALGQSGGMEVLLKEMLTVGVPMSVAITLVWAIWALLKERRQSRVSPSGEQA